MRVLIALALVACVVGCAPTMVTRTIKTTTRSDGFKETVDTKDIRQNLNIMTPKAIQDVIDMQ